MSRLPLNRGGFTLIELLLSVAIIALITGLSLPMVQAFQARSDLDTTAQSITSALRRAALYARNGNGDSTWSFTMQPADKAFYIYKGSNFAGRDSNYDEASSLMGGAVTTSGLSAVTFSKLTGLPNATGSIVITNANNDTRTITLNAKGMVNY